MGHHETKRRVYEGKSMNQYNVSGILTTYAEKVAGISLPQKMGNQRLHEVLRELKKELDLRSIKYEER